MTTTEIQTLISDPNTDARLKQQAKQVLDSIDFSINHGTDITDKVMELKREVELMTLTKDELLNLAKLKGDTKKRLYGHIDISEPMSKEEKQLNQEIAQIFSVINYKIMLNRKPTQYI